MKKLLLQLDPDKHPSAFDRIVAYDAGADDVLSYGGVAPGDVAPLVHGAIFTRGPAELAHTGMPRLSASHAGSPKPSSSEGIARTCDVA